MRQRNSIFFLIFQASFQYIPADPPTSRPTYPQTREPRAVSLPMKTNLCTLCTWVLPMNHLLVPFQVFSVRVLKPFQEWDGYEMKDALIEAVISDGIASGLMGLRKPCRCVSEH